MTSNKKREEKDLLSYIPFLLPTITCIGYMLFSIINIFLKWNICNIYTSKNYDELLKSTISFISIINSFLGLLISILISNKDKSDSLQYFLERVDTTYFSRCLKQTIASGLFTILLSCILLINDIFLQLTIIILNSIWIWFFLFYIISTYRFISILLDLFLNTKGFTKKQTLNEISKEDECKLKETLKNR